MKFVVGPEQAFFISIELGNRYGYRFTHFWQPKAHALKKPENE
jgi:hypothetical protein